MLDMDKRSKVINLCPWAVSFTLPNSGAEILIESNKTTTINNGELVALADNQNVMFWGTNYGDHARIFVENEEYRKHVGFDDEENKKVQLVLTKDVCDKLVELKTDSAFKKNVEEKVSMPHEKAIFMEYCRKYKFNDHNKITFLEEYTGEKF
jgi:hypothetical protein